ncbi:MAG: dethiobiotin synthase [Desulfovibrio sp.]
MGVVFVTGIDTEVGKTVVCGLMARAAFDRSASVATWKPVQTGAAEPEDIREHRRIANSGPLPEDGYGVTCPYLFEKPASPHLAAELEDRTIRKEVLDTTIGVLNGVYDHVIAEGAGGLMVPLNNIMTTMDYVQEKGWPLVIVASGRLGSINHTFLTLYAAKNSGIDVVGVVYNKYPSVDGVIEEDTELVLKKGLNVLFPEARLISIPKLEDVSDGDLDNLFEFVQMGR